MKKTPTPRNKTKQNTKIQYDKHTKKKLHSTNQKTEQHTTWQTQKIRKGDSRNKTREAKRSIVHGTNSSLVKTLRRDGGGRGGAPWEPDNAMVPLPPATLFLSFSCLFLSFLSFSRFNLLLFPPSSIYISPYFLLPFTSHPISSSFQLHLILFSFFLLSFFFPSLLLPFPLLSCLYISLVLEGSVTTYHL